MSVTKEFALLGLKIGFEEGGIVILKKDFKYKILTSDIIVIYDNQYAFSIIFYHQEKPFALEVIKKCFSPSLIETMNKTFLQFPYFTKSRSNFLDICREHETKSQSKTSSFEYLIGKPLPSFNQEDK